MTFVNLEAGSRTYIASMRVAPNFAPALAAGTRADRKTAAYHAMLDAEVAVKTTLAPKLDALKGEGLVRNYSGTGTILFAPVPYWRERMFGMLSGALMSMQSAKR